MSETRVDTRNIGTVEFAASIPFTASSCIENMLFSTRMLNYDLPYVDLVSMMTELQV